jgi:hypothetical protein
VDEKLQDALHDTWAALEIVGDTIPLESSDQPEALARDLRFALRLVRLAQACLERHMDSMKAQQEVQA